METPKTPEVTTKSTEPMFGVLSENARPEVRAYFENLVAQASNIIKSAGAKNREDLKERIESGEILLPLDIYRRYNTLLLKIADVCDTKAIPEEETLATTSDEITDYTLTYKGEITPEVIAKLPKGIEHVFTPEGKDLIIKLEIGGKTKEEILAEIEPYYWGEAKWIAKSISSKEIKHSETLKLIRIRVQDLGLQRGWDKNGMLQSPVWSEIRDRIELLGLQICPPSTGLYLRLIHRDDSENDLIHIGMKPINGNILALFNEPTYGPKLLGYGVEYKFPLEDEFVFSIPQ